MATGRSILTWGRGTVLILVGALVISFVSGWLRGHLLTATTPLVIAVPFLALRRLIVGVLLDLPTAAVLAGACGGASRLVATKPFSLALPLVFTVWGLDGLIAWLVSGDLVLWRDPFVVLGRLVMLASALVGGALAAGWRPRRRVRRDAQAEGGGEDTNEGGDESDEAARASRGGV